MTIRPSTASARQLIAYPTLRPRQKVHAVLGTVAYSTMMTIRPSTPSQNNLTSNFGFNVSLEAAQFYTFYLERHLPTRSALFYYKSLLPLDDQKATCPMVDVQYYCL